MQKTEGKRVFVGLSGGVDSAVAAALLKERGYDVAGVFMRFWKDGEAGKNACCSAESEAAARLVAGKLGIPFYVFDFSREFKREVVDYFLAELRAGRTPNPCVACNPQIKFGLFLARAKKSGADFVATGHYAKIVVIASDHRERSNPVDNGNISGLLRRSAPRNDIFGLFAAKDKQKDQSYFLYRLTQEQLSRVLFPLGDYTKDEVYGLAEKWQLPHQAHQSFDICFAGDYNNFLKKHLKMKPGKIVDIAGRLLGQHQGLPLYTIGQRASVGGPGPFYVVKKDAKKNILYVSSDKKDLLKKEMFVGNINWAGGSSPKLPLNCRIKIRYQAKEANAIIRLRSGHKSFIVFDKPQQAITPGQSAVFYTRKEVLGGGTIL